MSKQDKKLQCQIGCWGMAAVAGLVAFVMLIAVGDFAFFPAAFLGGLLFVVLGALLSWLFCTPVPALGEVKAPSAGPTATSSSSSSASATTTPAAATASASVATDAAGAEKAAAEAAAAEKAAAEAAAAEKAAAEAAAAEKAAAEAAAAEKAAAEAAAAEKAAAEAAAAEKAAAEAAAAEKAAAEAAAADAAAGGANSTPDYDGDGKLEGTDEGTKPEILDGPKGGKADNLKEIKGIGPKLEKVCNSIGVYHFEQIANWTEDEVAWVNANLIGFKGRVSRDNWVEQAKILAAGGETEFSKRVDSGSVY